MTEQPTLLPEDRIETTWDGSIPLGKFHMILNGDVLECLAELPDGCVDLVMTSPPYWGLRDYGIGATDWGDWKGQQYQH
jgi:DNA modification methylase